MPHRTRGGLHRRQRFFARRVADLTREARGHAPSSHPADDAAPTPGGGDIDPSGLAALAGAPAAAGAGAGAGAGAPGVAGGGGDAEALISQIARQQLEFAFKQQQQQQQPGGHRHPLALASLDDAARLAPGAAGGDHHTQHHEGQQREQQHARAADLTPAEPAGAGPASEAAAAAVAAAPRGGIPRSIVVLSCVSMVLTSASCVFNTLLPIYMVAELKLTMRSLGMFEGVLEAFSYVVRMFSGVLSDRMTSRKAAIAAGFAMGAAAKCGMSFAGTIGQLFIGKAIDRLGNGVQAAPRDALIGDLSPSASRSACFGFAQSMRKCGSFLGAGLVFALMKATGNNYQAIFLGAAAVSALATVAFVVFVPSHPNAAAAGAAEGDAAAAAAAAAGKSAAQQRAASREAQQEAARAARAPGDFRRQARALWRDVRSMGRDFYRTLAVIGLYGLGHINESLLEARAIEVGFGKAEATLVVALLCLSVTLCAYPLGRLDDKHGPRMTFALGMAALIAGDLVLLTSGAWPPAVFVACIFWGVHWAVVQGPMLGVVVGLAPPHLKGTAFGIFYSLMAVTAMAANTLFGNVWHTHGAGAAFGLSAAMISLTLVFALPRLLPSRATGAGTGAAALGAPPAAGGAAAAAA
ncbi:MAG: major facilitator superfamily domain-containing protein [Monoraphidium minutum]|nr:MAG: major facilitator superfamily domain-containing protein [Monoraphidium minutum]